MTLRRRAPARMLAVLPLVGVLSHCAGSEHAAAVDAGPRHEPAQPRHAMTAHDAGSNAPADGSTDGRPDALATGTVDAGSGDGPSIDAPAEDPPYAGPRFVDVTGGAGIDYVQTASWDCAALGSFACDPEGPHFTGGAVARDIDLDGIVDLAASRLDGPSVLYRGLGDGIFAESAALAGFAQIPLLNGLGAADIDNDGDADLFATAMGTDRYYLYVNDGAGGFTEDAIARGAAVETTELHQGTSVAFGDFDRDGYLDLFIGEWKPSAELPSYARLLKNRGAAEPGFFDDVTENAGVAVHDISGVGTVAFAPTFSDLDADGWPDLAIVSDFGSSRLFWNEGNGTFSDGSVAARIGGDENGMGSAIGDWDTDGDLDWFVTNIYDAADSCSTTFCTWGATGNRLYAYEGSRTFRDATDEANVRDGGWGWGAAFFDPDNDGDLDLVAASAVHLPHLAEADPFRETGLYFWENLGGGRMRDVTEAAGLDDPFDAKAIAVVDFDADGDEDLFVTSNGGRARLFRNDGGNASSWLRVRLIGTTSARDAFGARVTLRPSDGQPDRVRELQGGSGYLSTSEPIVHFGLGPGTDSAGELRIVWPRTGSEQVLTGVAGRGTIVVTER